MVPQIVCDQRRSSNPQRRASYPCNIDSWCPRLSAIKDALDSNPQRRASFPCNIDSWCPRLSAIKDALVTLSAGLPTPVTLIAGAPDCLRSKTLS